MALEQSYSSSSPANPTGQSGRASSDEGNGQYWSLSQLKECFTEFVRLKRDELEERRAAKRYYHGSQYTDTQIKSLKKRNQPAMTYNRVARKIDGVVGLIEKLRQDPKAYARTPMHEEGADLATAALNYVLDEQAWKEKSPVTAHDGAVGGIGGIEIILEQGDQGDPEVGFEPVDEDSFFYDSLSKKADFSDATFMGVSKLIEFDEAKRLLPGVDFESITGNDFELVTDSDFDRRWFTQNGKTKRIRMVDIWYKHNGGWCWAFFCGAAKFKEGKSYLKDEKGQEICKYVMYSANVDQDGDRYGFIRNMKSAQDGINARQSKMQHIMASKRLILSQGAVDDIEKIRKEWARPDGVVITNRPVNEGVKADDQSFDFAGWTKMLELSYQEIENFGPNPALIGQGLENQSGRAIALLQQAGMAELGPYMLAYRGWKIRVYRALWNCLQQHWKSERWIRVTDSQNLAQYLQINRLGIDPVSGLPTIINPIGSLDVDIIMDEGPDHVNAMQDMYETLSNVVPAIAPMLNPMQANSIVNLLVETSPLPSDVKRRWQDEQQQAAQMQQEPPEVQAAKMKAEIDAKSEEAKAQRENAKAAADVQIKREDSAAEIALMREKAQVEIEIMMAKAKAQIEIEKIKASQAIEIEQVRAEQSTDIEREKADISHENMKEEAKIKRQTMKQQSKAKEPA